MRIQELLDMNCNEVYIQKQLEAAQDIYYMEGKYALFLYYKNGYLIRKSDFGILGCKPISDVYAVIPNEIDESLLVIFK